MPGTGYSVFLWKGSDMMGTDENVQRTQMFQRWMEKRGRMQRSIAWLLISPSILLAVAATAYWFQYYLPVPLMAILVLLGVSALAFLVCLALALTRLKRLSDGDRIMWKMRLTEPESS